MPSTPKAGSATKPNLGPKAGPANRRALIEAAREVFRDEGIAAPFSAVARRAGVGQGSLYRHFPDRMSLAVAVFDENITDLEALAAQPESTVDDLFDAIAEQAMASTAMIEMISAHADDERAAHLVVRVTAVADTIRARALEAGRIAPHIETADVVLAVSMLTLSIARAPGESRADIAARARALLHTAFAPAAAGGRSSA